jgi:hypothetical protein
MPAPPLANTFAGGTHGTTNQVVVGLEVAEESSGPGRHTRPERTLVPDDAED